MRLTKKTDALRTGFCCRLLIFIWGALLLNSDSYSVCYMLLTILAFSGNWIKWQEANSVKYQDLKMGNTGTIVRTFSVLFSCMVTGANYQMWNCTDKISLLGQRTAYIYNFAMFSLILFGGYFAFESILSMLYMQLNKIVWREETDNGTNPRIMFLVCFISNVMEKAILLFLCQYPGELTFDSIDQINQLVTGNYSNHHPVYHTIFIKLFYSLGMSLFHDASAAIAVYNLFQIIFISACFSVAVSTLAQIKVPKKILVLTMLFYLLMPYHIIYAFTVWKDVMFAGFVLLLTLFIFRYVNRIGSASLSQIVICVSGLGVSLFRSNGLFVYTLIFLSFAFLWGKRYLQITVNMGIVLILSLGMKHLVLQYYDVKQPDVIEALSIPAQQIARVITEGRELEKWEIDLIGDIVDFEAVPKAYLPYISDPIKTIVRKKGNQKKLVEMKWKYIKVYCALGLKYPMDYAKSWIDQTRGYWNSGYEYWRWSLSVDENNMGIKRTTKSTTLDAALNRYLWLFPNVQPLRIFLSIGFFVWVDLTLLMLSILRKSKMGIFLSLPIIAVILSLVITTPVYAEFRYSYAVFCVIPVTLLIALSPNQLFGDYQIV